MNLFTTSATIVAAIEDIRSTGKKLDNMIQVAACSVIQHVEKHGDITLVNTLIDAMPNGSRVNALRDFIATFGKVAYDEATKAFTFDKAKKTDLAGAQAIMWTEFKPEQPYVAFDLSVLLASVLKKADKALSDAPQEVDLELLAALRSVVETQVDADPLNAEPVTT
jgi:hypothetical protein